MLYRTDEDALTREIVTLASEYGRYGYRRITALLRGRGWHVGKDRVQRIWRREGLKVAQKQRPRGRLWLNDGSCLHLRPERANHVWSYDFVSAMTHDGRTLRMLTLIDEYTRECLAIRVARRLGRYEVIEALRTHPSRVCHSKRCDSQDCRKIENNHPDKCARDIVVFRAQVPSMDPLRLALGLKLRVVYFQFGVEHRG